MLLRRLVRSALRRALATRLPSGSAARPPPSAPPAAPTAAAAPAPSGSAAAASSALAPAEGARRLVGSVGCSSALLPPQLRNGVRQRFDCSRRRPRVAAASYMRGTGGRKGGGLTDMSAAALSAAEHRRRGGRRSCVGRGCGSSSRAQLQLFPYLPPCSLVAGITDHAALVLAKFSGVNDNPRKWRVPRLRP